MYTFIILAAFFLVLSGVIFRKNMKQNQFSVILIIFLGTFVGSAIINGIGGVDIPYTTIVVKEKVLKLHTSSIIDLTDTIKIKTYINYSYSQEADSSIEYNYIDVGYGHDNLNRNHQERISFKYLDKNDSIPYFKILKDKKISNSKWISSVGLPRRGDRRFEVYLPNDSIHNILMDNINNKYIYHEEK